MDNLAQHFWTGCGQGKLYFQRCTDCRHAQFFPRNHCMNCNNDHLEWQASKGTGTIYSATRVERAPTEDLRALAPYAIALVDLDEGIRIMAHCNLALKIGDKAHAVFFTHNDRSLPRFEPL